MPLRSLLLAGLAALPSYVHSQDIYLNLEDAWVRALPPAQPTTAAYLTLRNAGDRTATVTGATVDGASRVEIHHSREVDGLMRMEPLSKLEVAPGESLVLAPGGTHLMLFELDAMPRPGETRRLCLTLEEADPVCTEAQVRKGADKAHQHHHH